MESENLTTEGIDLTSLAIGALLTVGGARLAVVRVGKDPSQANTYNYQGYSILPKQGIFCKAFENGKVKIEDPVRLIRD
jgi:molybdopterin adenylyltransferase